MGKTYTIEIPDWTPPRINRVRGRHWSAEAKAKKEAANFIGTYGFTQGVPKATSRTRRRVSLVVTFARKSHRLPDRDAFDKILLDALVQNCFLWDDGPGSLLGRIEVEYKRGDKRHTTVVIEDA